MIVVTLDDPWAMWAADAAFRDEVDEVLLSLIDDGTWETLVARWLGSPPPLTVEEMLAVPPIDR